MKKLLFLIFLVEVVNAYTTDVNGNTTEHKDQYTHKVAFNINPLTEKSYLDDTPYVVCVNNGGLRHKQTCSPKLYARVPQVNVSQEDHDSDFKAIFKIHNHSFIYSTSYNIHRDCTIYPFHMHATRLWKDFPMLAYNVVTDIMDPGGINNAFSADVTISIANGTEEIFEFSNCQLLSNS